MPSFSNHIIRILLIYLRIALHLESVAELQEKVL